MATKRKHNPTVIDEMIAEVVAFREDRDWRQYHSPKDLALGMIIEASELAEHFQYWQGDDLTNNVKKFKTEIGEELSDVLYWVLLTAHDMDVDLVAAFREKMRKNALKYPAEVGVGKGFDRNAAKDAKNAKKINDLEQKGYSSLSIINVFSNRYPN